MKPWFRHYIGATRDPKFKRVAMRTGQRLGDVIFVWDTLEESASEVDDAGAYKVDAADIAYELRCEPADIAAILEAFEAPDVRLIGGGIITKWSERQFASDNPTERVKEWRGRQPGKRPATQPPAETPELPLEAPPAAAPPPCNGDATLHRCYSNGDATPSESETDSETDSSSVVVPFATREAQAAPPTTDDEILFLNLKRIFGGKASAKAIRAAAPLVSGWIRDGCDLSADVLPELAEIAAKLRKPLNSFAAPFLRVQVFARRDVRLFCGEARAPPMALTAPRPRPKPPPELAPVSPEKRAEIAAMLKSACAAVAIGGAAAEAERLAARSGRRL